MALTQVSSGGIADGAVTTNDLENSGVTAGTYGSSSAIPAITVDAKGRITSASTSSIDSTAITNGTSNVSVAASSDITVTQAGNEKLRADGNGIVVTGRADISGDLIMGGELNIIGGSDANKYLDVRLGSSAFVVRGTSGGDTGHETLAQFERNGSASLFYDNNQKLLTTSTGIDVTGTVTCDGLTSEGTATFAGSSEYQLIVKDNNSTGTAAEEAIAFRDNADTTQGYLGYVDSTSEVFWAMNTRNAAIVFGTNNTGRCQVNNAGHFVPNASNTYDLGLSTNRWRNVYTNDLNLSNEGGTNDVDGTWGSWTIQEGEDDLFLLNRRNGKKYKFNLTEVN